MRAPLFSSGPRSRTPRWLHCLCLIPIAAGATAPAAPAAAADEEPNFLHILTDDQTVDSLRYMSEVGDLLKQRGTNFKRHHAVQPLCCPSRASFLTGRYPHNHGVLTNLPPYGYRAMDFSRTLYTAMHDAGYRTGWIGKVLNASGPDGEQPEPGFDEWLTPIRRDEGADMFDYQLSDNGSVRSISGTYQNRLYSRRAREFLASPSEQPFLLTLAPKSPHWDPCEGGPPDRRCPPQPDPRDRGGFATVRYPFGPDYRAGADQRRITNRYWRRELESLQSVDRMVGKLVADLRSSGELENTYVIFQSDNGMLHGERGIFDKNVPWDRSVRVPLVIRGPGIPEGRVRRDLTANVDVPATILDAAAVAPPLPLDGHSLLTDHRRRELLLERLIGGANRPRQPWAQIKTSNGWAYWEDGNDGRQHLYDLRSDPRQTRNLASRMPRMSARLGRRLEAIEGCADPCP